MSIHPSASNFGNIHTGACPRATPAAGGDLLDELHLLAGYTPGVDEDAYPLVECRPLEGLSDFVVNDLGEMYDDVLTGALPATELFDIAEQHTWSIDRAILPELLADPGSRRTRIAALDLAWIERFNRVAWTSAEQYRTRREVSRMWSMARCLSEAIGRHPFVQWTDIAEDYPSSDPRTFLSPGHDRYQEIHLYRAQSAFERGGRRIVEHWAGGGYPDDDAQREILAIWDGITKAMANLSRKRQSGEFEKLDRFLSPNDEVVGHGTGSFSAWVKLAGYLCTGRALMLGSITVPENWTAFTPEVMPWIREVMAGTLVPLDPGHDDLTAAIEKRATAFQLVHHGAVKRHAPSALSCPAPAMRAITNQCSMRRNICGHD